MFFAVFLGSCLSAGSPCVLSLPLDFGPGFVFALPLALGAPLSCERLRLAD